MLLMFCSLNFMQQFQWLQYSIIANIIVRFYDVTINDVNWTSVITFVVLIPIMIPCTWVLEKVGLRNYLIIGALFNFIATVIKCMSVNPTLFWVTLLGQAFNGISVPFIQPLSAQIARTWFPKDKISRATGIGVFSMFIGSMLSSLIPVLLVPNSDNKEEIAIGLSRMFIAQAVFAAIQIICILIYFEEEPPTPPSKAESSAYSVRRSESYFQSMKRVLNINLILILFVYAICGSESNSFLTVLNQMILQHFKKDEKLVGIIGFLANGGSMMSTFVIGLILDKYKCYKQLIFICYSVSCCLFIILAITIHVQSITLLMMVATILGFTINSYPTIIFNFASELTYPEPEGVSSSLCVLTSQILSTIATFVVSRLILYYGVLAANLYYSAMLVFAMILAAFVKSDLRRERTENETEIIDTESDVTSYGTYA
ncbi:feline leukemia virus subgroup C receptor-related protein 2-like protein [Leptotrombidium deliense]|uniref:Feline leukemia virus subgroup C receptor-related protein 2-like protein n=1 Tax=Leptotrombidium deliense TaxID=299467 RepID=A0A443SC41_9ACAR|nr:feline leukemia virus subgroup C receptor-related protein 2-like protein [Leptotrombidium deliense]